MNLFYPSHDLALANGVRHFTPPAAARRLGDDLAALSPLWQPEGAEIPLPWGWNYNTCKMLAQAGVAPGLLPSREDLELLRSLSSRTTVIDVLKEIQAMGIPEGDIAQPQAITTSDDLEHAIGSVTGNFLLKAPWSSSGRGLCWSRVTPRTVLTKRGMAVIREMGCVLLEPEYEKVQDLAMLFYADRSGVRSVGYSMFETDAMGTYRHGLIASNEAMEERLSRLVSREALHRVERAYAERILPRLLAPLMERPYPIGYVGVDMMVYRTASGDIKLHPCVEVNLRCTMGVVARMIYDRMVTPGTTGVYLIEHAANAANLRERCGLLLQEHPQRREAERCREGFFPLTEIGPESQFIAGIILNG